jgi:hypothetical protein
LLSHGYPEDAKRLAARAYLKASYEVEDDTARDAYREMAKQSLSMQTIHERSDDELTLDQLEQTFAKELEEAELWFEAVEADEYSWIASGVNPEEAFANKYYAEPEVTSPAVVPVSKKDIALGIAGLAILGIVVLGARRMWHRARATSKVTQLPLE